MIDREEEQYYMVLGLLARRIDGFTLAELVADAEEQGLSEEDVLRALAWHKRRSEKNRIVRVGDNYRLTDLQDRKLEELFNLESRGPETAT